MVDIKYVVFLSTFIVFSLESFLHFNIGKNGLTTLNIPTVLEAFEIIAVVLLFSGINAVLRTTLKLPSFNLGKVFLALKG